MDMCMYEETRGGVYLPMGVCLSLSMCMLIDHLSSLSLSLSHTHTQHARQLVQAAKDPSRAPVVVLGDVGTRRVDTAGESCCGWDGWRDGGREGGVDGWVGTHAS